MDATRLARGGARLRRAPRLADEWTSQIEQPRAEMRAVLEQIRGATPHAQEKRERRLVPLQRVAGTAGEDEVVAPVVGGLTASRRHMVERHHPRVKHEAAVRAVRPIVREQPRSRRDLCVAGRWMRGEIAVTVSRRRLRRRLLSSASLAWSSTASRLVRFAFLHRHKVLAIRTSTKLTTTSSCRQQLAMCERECPSPRRWRCKRRAPRPGDPARPGPSAVQPT